MENQNQIPIAGCQPILTCGAEVKIENQLAIAGTQPITIISNN